MRDFRFFDVNKFLRRRASGVIKRAVQDFSKTCRISWHSTFRVQFINFVARDGCRVKCGRVFRAIDTPKGGKFPPNQKKVRFLPFADFTVVAFFFEGHECSGSKFGNLSQPFLKSRQHPSVFEKKSSSSACTTRVGVQQQCVEKIVRY